MGWLQRTQERALPYFLRQRASWVALFRRSWPVEVLGRQAGRDSLLAFEATKSLNHMTELVACMVAQYSSDAQKDAGGTPFAPTYHVWMVGLFSSCAVLAWCRQTATCLL